MCLLFLKISFKSDFFIIRRESRRSNSVVQLDHESAADGRCDSADEARHHEWRDVVHVDTRRQIVWQSGSAATGRTVVNDCQTSNSDVSSADRCETWTVCLFFSSNILLTVVISHIRLNDFIFWFRFRKQKFKSGAPKCNHGENATCINCQTVTAKGIYFGMIKCANGMVEKCFCVSFVGASIAWLCSHKPGDKCINCMKPSTTGDEPLQKPCNHPASMKCANCPQKKKKVNCMFGCLVGGCFGCCLNLNISTKQFAETDRNAIAMWSWIECNVCALFAANYWRRSRCRNSLSTVQIHKMVILKIYNRYFRHGPNGSCWWCLERQNSRVLALKRQGCEFIFNLHVYKMHICFFDQRQHWLQSMSHCQQQVFSQNRILSNHTNPISTQQQGGQSFAFAAINAYTKQQQRGALLYGYYKPNGSVIGQFCILFCFEFVLRLNVSF